MKELKYNFVDIHQREVYPALITIHQQRILSVKRITEEVSGYMLPGFIDSHVHIESSMLTPVEFAKVAVRHGTIATISDPHEIANVLGIRGVEYMIENGKQTPFYFNFGAPSCVPATSFETAGAIIDSEDIQELLKRKEIVYLAEMMNYPGVIHHNEEVHKKLEAAKQAGKPIDGHAPGLKGEEMQQYFSAGITTDHECFTYEEGREKAAFGVKILIREGSAAKNFNDLIPLLNEFPDQIMFCSDDKHPDDLLLGHINLLVKRALSSGYNLFDVLRAASLNAIKHYKLETGCLRQGDFADFILVNNLTDLEVLSTYIKGDVVYEGISFINAVPTELPNNFNCTHKLPEEFRVEGRGAEKIRVIEALDGQLITNLLEEPITPNANGALEADVARDLLKITVVNRYMDAPVAVAFIKGIGLKQGAIASCVAHDCHNIVAVSTNDDDLVRVINTIIDTKGGIALCNGNEVISLPLPIAGIMSPDPAEVVGLAYTRLDKRSKELGCTLRAPFMTLSFMALLVIPRLKLSDLGLFDGKEFAYKELLIKKTS